MEMRKILMFSLAILFLRERNLALSWLLTLWLALQNIQISLIKHRSNYQEPHQTCSFEFKRKKKIYKSRFIFFQRLTKRFGYVIFMFFVHFLHALVNFVYESTIKQVVFFFWKRTYERMLRKVPYDGNTFLLSIWNFCKVKGLFYI